MLSGIEVVNEDFLFEAYLDSVKHISVLLRAVNFKDVRISNLVEGCCLLLISFASVRS